MNKRAVANISKLSNNIHGAFAHEAIDAFTTNCVNDFDWKMLIELKHLKEFEITM
ncbi:hypothetical protein [Psychromonas aquimarina]|uniref:hypothetical protein n=1 Tax=Psychromonas aquimarina TaxID=444919 RepID=UPI000421DB29|nr:hypothetical protein [Psychromonas aquimarina]